PICHALKPKQPIDALTPFWLGDGCERLKPFCSSAMTRNLRIFLSPQDDRIKRHVACGLWARLRPLSDGAHAAPARTVTHPQRGACTVLTRGVAMGSGPVRASPPIGCRSRRCGNGNLRPRLEKDVRGPRSTGRFRRGVCAEMCAGVVEPDNCGT